MSLSQLAASRTRQQIPGQCRPTAFLVCFLNVLPIGCAQAVQNRRNVLARAHVPAQTIGLMHRHKQPVAHSIIHLQVLALGAVVQLDLHQADKLADSMLHVHHEVARLDVGEKALGRHRTRPV